MKCPICGNVLENGYCNTCKRVIHPLYQHTKKTEDNEVIEAELVEDDDNFQKNKHHYQRYSYRQSPFFTQYTFRNNSLNNSCLMGILSLALIFFVFIQMGFLAALGFAFFITIGKIITTILFFKNLLEGRFLPPVILDIAVWILSYALVTWLD